MARVNVYQSDPMLTWAKPADEYDDYFEIPAVLLTDFEHAEAALNRARDAVTGYIREHQVAMVSPWDEADR